MDGSTIVPSMKHLSLHRCVWANSGYDRKSVLVITDYHFACSVLLHLRTLILENIAKLFKNVLINSCSSIHVLNVLTGVSDSSLHLLLHQIFMGCLLLARVRARYYK